MHLIMMINLSIVTGFFNSKKEHAMKNKGSIIIEATIILTITIFILAISLKEIIFVKNLVDDYYINQESVYTEAINKSIKEMRIEKARLDGK